MAAIVPALAALKQMGLPLELLHLCPDCWADHHSAGDFGVCTVVLLGQLSAVHGWGFWYILSPFGPTSLPVHVFGAKRTLQTVGDDVRLYVDM